MLIRRVILIIGLSTLVYLSLHPLQWGHLTLQTSTQTLKIPLFIAIILMILCCLTTLLIHQMITWGPQRLKDWRMTRQHSELQNTIDRAEAIFKTLNQGHIPKSPSSSSMPELNALIHDIQILFNDDAHLHTLVAALKTPLGQNLLRALQKQQVAFTPSSTLSNFILLHQRLPAHDLESIAQHLTPIDVKQLYTLHPTSLIQWLEYSLPKLSSETFEKVWALLPKSLQKHPKLHLTWACAAEQHHMFKQPQAWLKTYLSLTKAPALDHVALIWPEHDLDHWLQWLSKAHLTHSNTIIIPLALARTYYRKNQLNQALQHYQSIERELYANHSQYLPELAQVYQQIGNHTAALKAIQHTCAQHHSNIKTGST